jgi:hypothetical protein
MEGEKAVTVEVVGLLVCDTDYQCRRATSCSMAEAYWVVTGPEGKEEIA